MPGKSPFKHLTKKQYESLAPDEKLDYLVAAIQAKTDALYVPDPEPSQRRLPRKPARR